MSNNLYGPGVGMSDEAYANVVRNVGPPGMGLTPASAPKPFPHWCKHHPAARRLPRRPPVYFPKKCPGWKPEGVAGKRVVHPIWLRCHSEFRYGGSAKLRRPYKMLVAEEACLLTPEDLADVKEILLEIEEFNAARRKVRQPPS